jgi:serine/threonine-protein kinase
VSARPLLEGRYEVGDIIGRGGMADVHAGFDTRLSRPVAIKILHPELARDANFLSRFRREAQSAGGLNHPSIVSIFDSGEQPSVDASGATVLSPFIVMEYVHGRTLRQVLSEHGPMAPAQASRIVEGVLAALAYSHRMGIVHRDIKPANVMIGENGQVKVMDFGIARAMADTAATQTQTQAVIGTAQYLSPEQARGLPVDARSDLYSTGCMLFELLTGRTPFMGETPISIAYQHVGEAPQPPSIVRHGIPPAFDAVVLHAMAKDRDARYQSAGEFLADLVAAREGRPVSAAARGTAEGNGVATTVLPSVPSRPVDPYAVADRPTSIVTPVGRDPQDEPRKRRRAAYVLLAIAAVAALALLAVFGRAILADRSKPQQVAVPYVIGSPEETARALLTSRNLTPDIRKVSSVTVKEGYVINQDPTSDTTVDVGTVVHVDVSSGQDSASVPAVVGQDQAAATTMLKVAKFADPAVVPVDDPSQAKGLVVSVDPGVGQVVPLTTKITLKVASGNVKVPNLVGVNTSLAQDKVVALKLSYDDSQVVEDGTHLEGTVISQDTPADSVVPIGTTIKVQVAKHPTATVTTTVTTTSSPTTSSTFTSSTAPTP